ncbi:hypothetical protein FF38_05473 [Lucilia cuprina]|uniref:Lipase domain-containing protein n=1 Tax=Lucilia cuprina TaxID=7375 RepID=A0A0L0C0K2_LUCCU|nr:Pancreatic lipase-related protein 2 [Lucilia cuprina]KNC25786.1 hypothetical protein FF38_05473 [Lucilia cuprina]
MHFLHSRFISIVAFISIILILQPKFSIAFGHKWHAMKSTFRYLQETMLRTSLNRAQLNYGIIFECRTTSNVRIGEEAHFSLQLGDLKGFRMLDSNKRLALFLHGWNDEGSKGWVQEMLRTWTYFDPECSVCVVDWGNLSQNDYKTASMSIFDVGLTVAGIVEALEQLSLNKFSRRNVTIAGYSLGAHAAGFAGTALNGEVEQIIGLDPAGPLFTMPSVVSPEYRLDQSDAQFVQILHTSAGTLGSGVKAGHADFYPNGGKAPQSNCRLFMNLQDVQNTNPIACSHSTAAVFFKQSMDPTYAFMGYHCDSYKNYARGLCWNNRRGRFGIHSQRASYGNFYFDTEPNKPYVKQTTRRRWRPPQRWNSRYG